eukprot:2947803-Pyramimonas_sp.AAC.1
MRLGDAAANVSRRPAAGCAPNPRRDHIVLLTGQAGSPPLGRGQAAPALPRAPELSCPGAAGERRRCRG